MNIADPIGEYSARIAAYLRQNEAEAIDYILTGKIGETLIECPESRKIICEKHEENAK